MAGAIDGGDHDIAEHDESDGGGHDEPGDLAEAGGEPRARSLAAICSGVPSAADIAGSSAAETAMPKSETGSRLMVCA